MLLGGVVLGEEGAYVSRKWNQTPSSFPCKSGDDILVLCIKICFSLQEQGKRKINAGAFSLKGDRVGLFFGHAYTNP